jgi:lipoprotein NlpD
LLSILLFVAVVAGCTANKTGGVYHVVKKDDTLWSIARAYNIDVEELAEINNLQKSSLIKTGVVVFIPDASKVISVKPPKETPKTEKIVKKTEPAPKKEVKKNRPQTKTERNPSGKDANTKKVSRKTRFIWPLNGYVCSKFGLQKNGMRSNGIGINTKGGAPVLASASGTVIHSASIKHYGETIIIRHDNSYSTVYSHLDKRIVKVNEYVKKGETIAFPEKEKNGKTCFLHFEIRYKNRAKNPLLYLPREGIKNKQEG